MVRKVPESCTIGVERASEQGPARGKKKKKLDQVRKGLEGIWPKKGKAVIGDIDLVLLHDDVITLMPGTRVVVAINVYYRLARRIKVSSLWNYCRVWHNCFVALYIVVNVDLLIYSIVFPCHGDWRTKVSCGSVCNWSPVVHAVGTL